jgi:hypothetical protein
VEKESPFRFLKYMFRPDNDFWLYVRGLRLRVGFRHFYALLFSFTVQKNTLIFVSLSKGFFNFDYQGLHF